MQTKKRSTECRDMNGKEIFEGNTVRFSRWSTKDGFSPMGQNGWQTGTVIFKNGRFVVTGDEAWDTLQYKNIQLIENIPQKKDLLRRAKISFYMGALSPQEYENRVGEICAMA